MCMLVVAGTDEMLPPVQSENAFLLQVRPLYPENASVLRLFSKPHIYDLSSVEGCGCGFSYSPQELELQSDAAAPEEVKTADRIAHEQSRDAVRLLQQLLRRAAGSGTAELYSCWIGEEGEEPETRQTVSLSHFDGEEFYFMERQFLTVSRE